MAAPAGPPASPPDVSAFAGCGSDTRRPSKDAIYQKGYQIAFKFVLDGPVHPAEYGPVLEQLLQQFAEPLCRGDWCAAEVTSVK